MSDGVKKPQLVTLTNPSGDNWISDRLLPIDIGGNPYLPPEYKQHLLNMTHTERARFLHGEWKIDMKTAIIFDSCGEADIKFYVTDQQVDEFDGKFINHCENPEQLQDKMVDFFYTESGDDKQTPVSREEFIAALSSGAKLIVCGFLP